MRQAKYSAKTGRATGQCIIPSKVYQLHVPIDLFPGHLGASLASVSLRISLKYWLTRLLVKRLTIFSYQFSQHVQIMMNKGQFPTLLSSALLIQVFQFVSSIPR